MNNEQVRKQIELLTKEINGINKRIEEYKKEQLLYKKTLRKQRATLVRKIAWQEYSEKNFIKKDYTKTLAFELFGKRLKDLTKEEKREYNKILTRKIRQKNKKNNMGAI